MLTFAEDWPMAGHHTLAAEFLSAVWDGFTVRVLNMPPRSSKTSLAKALIDELMRRGLAVLYVAPTESIARLHGEKATFAVGFGGALTGRNFDAIVLDDASETFAYARPADVARYLGDWFGQMSLKLAPDGAIFCLESRRGANDTTAWLLKRYPEHAARLSIPAILSEPEKSYWPEYWPLEKLRENRAATSVRAWQQTWQQEVEPT